jgi:hypothetical protein
VSLDTQSFLQSNADNIISLADVARPTAELLAKYSPEYPCVISQMAQTVPKIDQALGKGTNKPGLRATIEIGPNRGPYRPGEEPKFEDKRGPRCYDMKQFPTPFPQNPPDGPIKDGSNPPAPARSVSDGLMPPANGISGGGSGSAAAGPANSPQEAGVLSYLVGRQTQTPPAQVPGWSGMLVGPLYRGAAVTVR